MIDTDVVTVGEAMAFVVPEGGDDLAPGARMVLGVGGAESNVAMGLARLGVSSAWLSAVGDDPLGRMILSEVAAAGVDVSAVRIDPIHPTGAYFKLHERGRSTPVYFRRGSAASHLDRSILAHIASTRVTHVSGVALALSSATAELVGAILERRPELGTVSFDVNHRSALWRDRSAADELLVAARRADIVFVGRDEAEALWGTATPAEVRSLLADVGTVVVKDAEVGATSFVGDTSVFVPSPRVDVVEPVGAGDAFAAGWLSGWLAEERPEVCLARGHVLAGLALTQWGDVPVVPVEERIRAAVGAVLGSS
ncbi:sugar kinase [Salinibacterium sp. ZJ77]|uniref:sugar kinase n=1 Tax=Salinibacterium sp. ZJ77 TaxID=2708337 RepID=UPI001421E75C|nr:sugar kinase [Salinibacterium sp. ZJ77]